MAATISPGIRLDDGTVLGRIEDIELFRDFAVQCDETKQDGEFIFSQEQRKKIARDNNGGRLWEVNRKGKGTIAKQDEAMRRRTVKLRTEVYTLANELGLMGDDDYDQAE